MSNFSFEDGLKLAKTGETFKGTLKRGNCVKISVSVPRLGPKSINLKKLKPTSQESELTVRVA